MREIKFRAWDGENKYMLDDVHFANPVYLNEFFRDSKKPEWDLIVMQFTGLKDKNGKEIYEGDIVYSGSCDWNYRIEFDRGTYWAIQTTLNVKKRDTQPIIFFEAFDFKVIGNIYQNPELLQDHD